MLGPRKPFVGAIHELPLQQTCLSTNRQGKSRAARDRWVFFSNPLEPDQVGPIGQPRPESHKNRKIAGLQLSFFHGFVKGKGNGGR